MNPTDIPQHLIVVSGVEVANTRKVTLKLFYFHLGQAEIFQQFCMASETHQNLVKLWLHEEIVHHSKLLSTTD